MKERERRERGKIEWGKREKERREKVTEVEAVLIPESNCVNFLILLHLSGSEPLPGRITIIQSQSSAMLNV